MKLFIGTLAILFLIACGTAIEYADLASFALICKDEESTGIRADECGCENVINEKVENLRKLLKEGNPEKGIPSFDPLKVEYLDLNPNSPILSGDLKISNLTLTGVTDFIKTEGCLDVAIRPSLRIGLSFNKIALFTNYTGTLNLFGMVNLFGTGKASIVLTDFAIDIVVNIRIPTIHSIEVAVVLPAIDVKLTGLLDNEYMSDIISRQLTDTLTTLAKEEEERINNILNDLLIKLLAKPTAITTDNIFTIVEEVIQTVTTKEFFMKLLP